MRDEPWALFWVTIVGIICLTIVACVVVSRVGEDRRLATMKETIANGTDPVKARCAVFGVDVGYDALERSKLIEMCSRKTDTPTTQN